MKDHVYDTIGHAQICNICFLLTFPRREERNSVGSRGKSKFSGCGYHRRRKGSYSRRCYGGPASWTEGCRASRFPGRTTCQWSWRPRRIQLQTKPVGTTAIRLSIPTGRTCDSLQWPRRKPCQKVPLLWCRCRPIRRTCFPFPKTGAWHGGPRGAYSHPHSQHRPRGARHRQRSPWPTRQSIRPWKPTR